MDWGRRPRAARRALPHQGHSSRHGGGGKDGVRAVESGQEDRMRQMVRKEPAVFITDMAGTCRALMQTKCRGILKLNEDDGQGHHTHSRHERLEGIGMGRTGRHKTRHFPAVHEKRDAVCFHGRGE